MEDRTKQMLFAVLRSAVCGHPLNDEEKALFSVELLPELGSVSGKHDLIHLLAFGLKKNALVSKNDAGIEQAILQAAYRYEQQNYVFGKLCEALEAAEIPFLPLKGTVIRQFYPKPWMRTSGDMDILVREEDAEKAASLLVEQYGYTRGRVGSHDISLYTPNKIHIELHYHLMEDGIANASSEVLQTVWSNSAVLKGYRFWHEMFDEMFYFYHIAHMAKHFENGGCGIRPFIDLWILDQMEGVDQKKRKALLRKGNLLKFAEAAQKLSRIWLNGANTDVLSQQMEHFILTGGVYGTSENYIMVQQQKKGGRFQYVLSKVFLSYDVIKFEYPVLQKHKWLTPIMEVRRWFRLIFGGYGGQTLRKLKYNQSITEAESEATKAFLRNIGL